MRNRLNAVEDGTMSSPTHVAVPKYGHLAMPGEIGNNLPLFAVRFLCYGG